MEESQAPGWTRAGTWRRPCSERAVVSVAPPPAEVQEVEVVSGDEWNVCHPGTGWGMWVPALWEAGSGGTEVKTWN